MRKESSKLYILLCQICFLINTQYLIVRGEKATKMNEMKRYSLKYGCIGYSARSHCLHLLVST